MEEIRMEYIYELGWIFPWEECCFWSKENEQLSLSWSMVLFFYFLNFIDFRERERQTDIDSLFHLFMHSLIDYFMYCDWRWNPQCWRIRVTSNRLSYPARAFKVSIGAKLLFDVMKPFLPTITVTNLLPNPC